MNERQREKERTCTKDRKQVTEKKEGRKKKNQIKLTAYAKAQRAYRRFPESNLIAGNGHN